MVVRLLAAGNAPAELDAQFGRAKAPIDVKDLDGRYVFVSDEWTRAYGMSRDAVLGRTDFDLFRADEAEERRARDQDVIAAGKALRFDETVQMDDGPHALMSIRFPLLNDFAEATAVCGIATDVTIRKRAQDRIAALKEELELRVAERAEQLEVANRELEAFTYSVSHDLRAPLRAIDGYSRLLLEDHADALDDEARRYLETVRASTQEMGELIDGLLRFSRLGNEPLTRCAVEPSELVASVLDELLAGLDGRQVDVDVGELPLVEADPLLLRQVFANLLANAFKYTRSRPVAHVAVEAVEQDGETRFAVRDDGIGFDMRFADKLFGVFQRLNRVEEYEGSGLGLALVERIVHRHGGRVWAEAVEGEGATFYFTLGGKT